MEKGVVTDVISISVFKVRNEELAELVSRSPELCGWLAELVKRFGIEQTVYLPPLSSERSAQKLSLDWSKTYPFGEGRSDLLSLYKVQTEGLWARLIQLTQERQGAADKADYLWPALKKDEARSVKGLVKELELQLAPLEGMLIRATEGAIHTRAKSPELGAIRAL